MYSIVSCLSPPSSAARPSLSGVCGPSHFLGFLALLVACVPPSISGAGHATRASEGRGCWRRKGVKGRRARKLRLPLLAAMIMAHVRALIGHVLQAALCHPFNAPILFFKPPYNGLLKISKCALSVGDDLGSSCACSVQAHLIVPFMGPEAMGHRLWVGNS